MGTLIFRAFANQVDKYSTHRSTAAALTGEGFGSVIQNHEFISPLSARGSRSLPFLLLYIILDEATASLDNESDATMQKVIKEEFDDCTNITIAHRLESVIGFDKVLVLDAGRILEFDTPRKLLESTESRFYELCEATGNLDVLQEMGK